MNAVALFVSKNTSTALPSGGLDSLFFPSVFQEKPLIEGLFFWPFTLYVLLTQENNDAEPSIPTRHNLN
ncbi:hypothetical protein PY546_15825 [Providencia stuartii]|nr:hypothetical protein [Providencia stuartii]